MALNIPKQIYAGDSLEFSDSLANYSAADGWTLKYSLINADSRYEIVSAADGSNYAFDIEAADTTGWLPGSYRWVAFVVKGTKRNTLASGNFEVKQNLAEEGDHRHHVERVLAALESTLEGKASIDQQSMSINGRSIARLTPGELLQWRDKYRTELANIKRAERIAQGLSAGNKVMVRF